MIKKRAIATGIRRSKNNTEIPVFTCSTFGERGIPVSAISGRLYFINVSRDCIGNTVHPFLFKK
jgi:hypothetical protein